ncbi:MAG TPA: HAMP domain-containing sensor histidine kinase [Gemmatimonadaceae bacterium]|nr:HAMP domain-containing sensor histidine kinase [Gemmatimonadaceae bacterium]
MPRSPSRWWALAAAATLVASAGWLRTGSVAMLAAAATLAALTGLETWRSSRSAVAGACAAALLALATTSVQGARRAAAFQLGAVSARSQAERTATRAFAARLDREADELRRIAVQALDAPADPSAAFDALARLQGNDPYRAVAVTRGGTLAAWAGHYLAGVDSLPGPAGVVASDFYLLMYAIAGRDQDRAVATTLVHASPPADVLARPLDVDAAEAAGVAGFSFRRPGPADTVGVVTAAGVPVLTVRATALGTAQAEQQVVATSGAREVALLAAALALFLAAMWRTAGSLRRFGALGVALGVVGVVPLAILSNRTAVFNPTYFFASMGGPFTGSIGALALTSAIVLVAILAAQRARLFPRRRRHAVLIIVAVAVLGPYLLGAIARGIRFPATGASVVLWLAWETTVFLAALAVLYAGLSAGEALGPRRGLPLWVAPVFAAAAAVLTQAIVQPRGGLPQWYTLLWVSATVLLALMRYDRRSLWSAAAVAAFGAVALVWSETVKARVLLAEQDVASLTSPDPAAAELVRRFPRQLDSTTAPRSRTELLARFAASDLASSDLPVDITSWTPAGDVIADLRVGMAPGTYHGVEYFAREVAQSSRPMLTNVPGEPGIHTVLAVPHADHTVTTVVVAPRTRLVTPDPFPTMTGLSRSHDVPGDPPYTLQPAPASAAQYISTAAQWTRRDQELHGDWFLPATAGQVLHVHARVPLEGFGPLVTRGALMVCVNLGVVGALWLLIVVADGGAVRRALNVAPALLRSYRARLSIALFVAFLLPAAGFAAWSYGRLQDEDAEVRTLLVRETLRGVTAASSAPLDSHAVRVQTPLMLFENGVMVGSSDPLLDALMPIGRLLPAQAARALLTDDDGFATERLTVGGEPMHFGFRIVGDSGTANFVLAAPARTADLGLDPRRRDLAFFVVFAVVVGALGALWLSGIGGRTFARPIGELRAGALALAAGEREPLPAGDPPLEFQPVFRAFRQMARDLEAGRARDARAQRVLAWGEMARQVAHEIKNPLTPMRLGVQHLMRARDDARVDFRKVFDENAARLLAEIDRLDEIARAFSRYGTAPDAQPAPEPVDVSEAVRDVVRLERLGGEAVTWETLGADAPVLALARPTELREVLLNLLENARLADVHRVVVRVRRDEARVVVSVEDDGHGISADALPRIFEPHFSTRTSGSGLGLAISRRLIDGWGGSISVASTVGVGTTVTISLVPAAPG